MTVPMDEIDPDLLQLLRDAGDRWGPMGVALAAVRLTDPEAVIDSLRQGDRPPVELWSVPDWLA